MFPLVNIRMQKNWQNCIVFCMRKSFENLLGPDLTVCFAIRELYRQNSLQIRTFPLGTAEVLDPTCVAKARQRYSAIDRNR